LHILAESNPNGVMVYDFKSGEVLYANRAIEKLTGYSSEELKNTKALMSIIQAKRAM